MIDHHLMADLRKLKLGGFGETLELRVAQAEKDELSHLAFLTLVMQDEIERREAKKLTVRIQKASFEEEKTLEELRLRLQPEDQTRDHYRSRHVPLYREERACPDLRPRGRREDPPCSRRSVTRPAGGDTASSS